MIRANETQVNGIIATLDDIDRKLTFIVKVGVSVEVALGEESEKFSRTDETNAATAALVIKLNARKTTLLATLAPL